MFGTHGSASATGARTAVVPASVRRALLLAALLTGALCAFWIMGVHSAQAQEGPGGSVDLPAVEGPGESEEPLPLRETLADSVSGAEGWAVQAVADTSAVADPSVLDPEALVEQSTLGRKVRETVHGPSSFVPAPEHRAGPDVHGDVEKTSAGQTPTDEEQPTERETRPVVDDGDTDVLSQVAPPRPNGEATAHEAVERKATGHESTVPVSSGLVSGASAGSTGTSAVSGGAVAGHLTSSGEFAPASGVLGAVRYALQAVPIDMADEPAFLPD